MPESIVFSGKIGEVIHTMQEDGRVFEQYRRSPGVRLIIVSPEGQILITKEKRQETNSIDFRLPGGKVCDTLVDYTNLRTSGGDILAAAKQAACKEAFEETALTIRNPQFLTKAIDGATVEWDLYYFLVRDYSANVTGQQLEQGEEIAVDWFTPAQIKTAIAEGKMQEWRSVGVLLGLVLPNL